MRAPAITAVALLLAVDWLGGQNPSRSGLVAAAPPKQAQAPIPETDSLLTNLEVPTYPGWHFGFGFGSVNWGADSRCGCGTARLDAHVGFETQGGLAVEYQLALQETVNAQLDHSLVGAVFPRWLGGKRPLGVYASGGVVSPLQRFQEQTGGWSYGYGVRARAPLGGRRKTRVFGELGVATVREAFTEEIGWRDVTLETRTVHSGLRVRIGVVW